MRGVRRVVWPVLLTMMVAAVLFLGVFPTRTYLAQRAALGTAEERLEVLQEENEALADRVEALHDDEEIEKVARAEYDMVRPDEEAYAVLPPPEEQEGGRAGADDAGGEGDEDGNVLERAWDAVTGLFS